MLILCAFDAYAERVEFAEINSVWVVITKSTEFERRLGLTEERLRTAFELQLRKAGLKVDNTKLPQVQLQVRVLADDKLETVAYDVEVSLWDLATIDRLSSAIISRFGVQAFLGCVAKPKRNVAFSTPYRNPPTNY